MPRAQCQECHVESAVPRAPCRECCVKERSIDERGVGDCSIEEHGIEERSIEEHGIEKGGGGTASGGVAMVMQRKVDITSN